MAAWQEAQSFAADVSRLLMKLPRNAATQSACAQLIRSAGSIGANIAEGFGRFSQPAYRNYLSYARGSAYETESWIDLLARLGFLTETDASDLLSRLDRIEAMITARMKSLTGRESYAVRDEGEEVYRA
jgi:four helix bundle protein